MSIKKIKDNHKENDDYMNFEAYSTVTLYSGDLSENDQIYKETLSLLEKAQEILGSEMTDSSFNPEQEFSERFHSIIKTIEQENGIELPFSDIEHFEDDFISIINDIEKNYPPGKKTLAIDSIFNWDYKHNPTIGIYGEMFDSGKFSISEEFENLNKTIELIEHYFNTQNKDKSNNTDSIKTFSNERF